MAPEMVAIRHQIHAHPELALEEVQTSNLVASKLTEWGYQVERGIGGTGLVGQLRRGNSHRRIGLRADMDALPIVERTGLALLQHGARQDARLWSRWPHGHFAVRSEIPWRSMVISTGR